MTGPLVLKLGGELLEAPERRAAIAAAAAAAAAARPLVIVHGGGRAVDAELDRRGIAPKKVDGLRITDAATLDVVVAVLGGSSNTELVAALVGQGVTAVGLSGVDAGFGRAVRSNAYRTTTGWSSPFSRRHSARASGPPCRSKRAAAGSPGSHEPIRNTRNETTRRSGTVRASRRSAKSTA